MVHGDLPARCAAVSHIVAGISRQSGYHMTLPVDRRELPMAQTLNDTDEQAEVVVLGGGPAGLMAAQCVARAGYAVNVYDAMPSVGRKFLRAGVGGLNLSHSEEFSIFCGRFSNAALVQPWLESFTPARLRHWATELGIETFVGSSGRIFPVQSKASPLLRAWLGELHQLGVRVHTRHRCIGWLPGEGKHRLVLATPGGTVTITVGVVIMAFGGGSWARLGSDGFWQQMLTANGVRIEPFQASNCGFNYDWSEFMRSRFAGAPLKSVAARVVQPGLPAADTTPLDWRYGEAVISRNGVQGGLVYHHSRILRNLIAEHGHAEIIWDLIPDRTIADVRRLLNRPRGKQSLANFLRKALGLTGVKLALLHELAPQAANSMETLAASIKALPQTLRSTRPIDEAISTAGGVAASELNDKLMLRRFAGVFCAGEMLDWDAPTGGYLLNASLASGRIAAEGAVAYLGGGIQDQ